ncbi:MAG: M28 family peptidase [Ignavibacteriales bacterium]|nr:M28 family peptidase [Ignavibacteriales bacterium]
MHTRKTTIVALFLSLLPAMYAVGGDKSRWNEMIGSAYTDNRSYALLQQICDEAGGRVMGSPSNEKGMSILVEELKSLGVEARKEPFTAPGWIRGAQEVSMTVPIRRQLRSIELAYVDHHETFEAPVVFAEFGFDESYASIDVAGKIVLVTQQRPPEKSPLLRLECIEIAARHGAKGILFINDRNGTMTLEGVSNFEGKPSLLPAYSITFEEGKWMERLLKDAQEVRVTMKTESRCAVLSTANIVATFPGVSKRKIVVGAHFDSWDMGQGAIDNGIGSAILFDLVRLLKSHAPKNYYTIELVWFNGEELGLWGSKDYVVAHDKDDILAMINMDMTGTPTGFNAMGFDEFIPFLKGIATQLSGFDLKDGVVNQPGLSSDHQEFMLRGIPTMSMQAHLDDDMGKYYHEMGDTFDKVSKRYLSDAAAIVGVLVGELANDRSIDSHRRNAKETAELMKKFKLDDRLKKMKEWNFKEQ